MDRTNDPDRRTVLKRLGAAAATGAAVGGTAAGTAAASETDGGVEMEARPVTETVAATPVNEAFDDPAIGVERVLDAYAGELLSFVAADGVLETGRAAELPTTAVAPTTDGSVEGVSAYRVQKTDGHSRQLTVDAHVAEGELTVSVDLDRETAVAELSRSDGTRVLYGDLGDGLQREVTADAPCCKCCVCGPITCSSISEARLCYGPERFGCPVAGDGCC